MHTPSFNHVQDLWKEADAGGLDELDRLVYRSNLLGQDWRIVNTGGGNTSSKVYETDPLTGELVDILWVKGSGGDLRTAGRANFASLYQEKLMVLKDLYLQMEDRGPKTPAEDRMIGYYPHCTYGLNQRAPSIDTPLHSFVPYRHVDHTHPVACIALATARRGEELTREVYGDEVVWVDWQRPGFELGLKLQDICHRFPDARGVLLGGHGLINWANDDRECYHLTLSLIDRAAAYVDEHPYDFGGAIHETIPDLDGELMLTYILPWLRGRISREKRFVGTIETGEDILEFVNGADAPRLAELGTSCPDHFLRTKIKPLYVDWNPEQDNIETLKAAVGQGLEKYQKDYAAYYEAHRHADSPAMRVAWPTVVLLPGLGMITWGKNKSESRVTAEFYKAAIAVMRGAEGIDAYTALPRQEAFDIEYWQLEEAKLRRMPPEKELSGRIVAVFGGASGIGREVVDRLIEEGAQVAVLDLDGQEAIRVEETVTSQIGMGIGVAGSGISECGDIIGIACDITDRGCIAGSLNAVVQAFGGLDHVVVTAGLFISPDVHGVMPDTAWEKTFAVNVHGPFLVADLAQTIWRDQGLSGSMVLTTSVNAVVPKSGSYAYDTSKAAANHLVHELAVALAPLVRVNGLAPATVLAGSSMFPRHRVLASLVKYGLECSENEDTETLRDRLAEFYAKRSLLGRPVTTKDQAEAIFLLVGERLGNTTGQIVTVDGGLPEAFLR